VRAQQAAIEVTHAGARVRLAVLAGRCAVPNGWGACDCGVGGRSSGGESDSGGASSSAAGESAAGAGNSSSGSGGASVQLAGSGGQSDDDAEAGAAGEASASAGAGGVPVCPAPSATHSSTVCDKRCWKVSASDCANYYTSPGITTEPKYAIDSQSTSWTTGIPQAEKSTWYALDLRSSVTIDGLRINESNVTSGPEGFLASFQIDVSSDGSKWHPVACGAGSDITDVAFSPIQARYVRVTQKADPNNSKWWGVREFDVYCAMTDTCPEGGAADGSLLNCAVQHNY
jgi:hypothetical protein